MSRIKLQAMNGANGTARPRRRPPLAPRRRQHQPRSPALPGPNVSQTLAAVGWRGDGGGGEGLAAGVGTM